MQELIIATRNLKKLKEIRELLAGLPVTVTSLADHPGMPHIDEDGETFAENAIKKAATIALYTHHLVAGEDSGLEVKALGGKPGIFSARFSGPKATDRKNNAKLLRELKGVGLKERQARYRCAVALVGPQGIVGVVLGSCSGLIAPKPKGTNGFGYDPLFFIPRYQKTFGELDPAIKAKISHRARALKQFRTLIRKALAGSRG